MRKQDEALIIIDIQNDFCPGGALAIPEGDAIVPGVNALMSEFQTDVLTQDWHPNGHSSFASSHQNAEVMSMIDMPYGPQVLWPDHCIQGSEGAEFHSDLHINAAHANIRKGFRSHIDSYSAFFENDRKTPTGLEGYLKTRGITKLTVVGLALDFCVNYSAVDGANLGFDVEIREQLCRGIDLNDSMVQAMEEFQKTGVKVV